MSIGIVLLGFGLPFVFVISIMSNHGIILGSTIFGIEYQLIGILIMFAGTGIMIYDFLTARQGRGQRKNC